MGASACPQSFGWFLSGPWRTSKRFLINLSNSNNWSSISWSLSRKVIADWESVIWIRLWCAYAYSDGQAVCCRGDAGVHGGREQAGQALLALLPRRERPQAVAGRQAQARRRIQVRIAPPAASAPATPRHLSCVLYHISEAMTTRPAPGVAIYSYAYYISH